MDNGFQPQRLRTELGRQCRSTVEDGIENRSRSISAKRQRPGGHLVKYGTKGEQIGTAIKLLSQCLFRRHVYDRAHGGAGTGQVTRRLSRYALRIVFIDLAAAGAAQLVPQRQLRQPEVENFGVATVGDENVRGFYVSMDNAMSMRSI